MYIDTMEKSSCEEVDLKYNLYTSEAEEALYIKFTGFDNAEQMKQFAEYMKSYLPLILYNSEVHH